jgi:ribosomal protein L16 Arg81 hydroxylase
MIVRRGARIPREAPPTYQEARELHASGGTLVIRNSERHHPALAQLAAGFRQDFHAPVDIHIYCTPAGESGFGWHYDAEDVFILQTDGTKEYSLRKNTVHPWPLVETIPHDMRYEREIMPVMVCTLAAGDWLYIPAGYWHRARAADPTQSSISLAIGIMAPSAISLFDFLRQRLVQSLLWRQRLPPSGSAVTQSSTDLAAQFRTILTQLRDDLNRALNDENLVHDFLHNQAQLHSNAETEQPSHRHFLEPHPRNVDGERNNS